MDYNRSGHVMVITLSDFGAGIKVSVLISLAEGGKHGKELLGSLLSQHRLEKGEGLYFNEGPL